ncbi:unnamed protein product [Urochloa decumbens]|uniref:Uncharacterized protein n=1 Tax=Urochloa decumbens TaxID=240449 RepID=A0ABC9GZI9_9POAL
MVSACRIFNDLAEQLAANFLSKLAGNIVLIFDDLGKSIRLFAHALRIRHAGMSTWCSVLPGLPYWTIILLFQSMGYVAACLYGYSGPFVCIALALWRIAQRDYTGGDASSSSPGNLVPALVLFYSFILLQGGLYALWLLSLSDLFTGRQSRRRPAHKLSAYRQQIGLPDEGWCREYLARYLSDIRARCWREPASIRGRTLRHFALESLDSGSLEEMHAGVRWLDALARQGEDLRPQLLPCRPRIQKLIDALGWRTTKQRRPNQLILQGLAILEGLAFDHHNCQAICSTPGLLRKIMAPLSSAHLMHDIRNNVDWARVVSGSFKVLYMLIKAPGESSWWLRREICSNEQSMSNLDRILKRCDEASGLVLLQMGAMGILTQLALDLSVNLAEETKKNLVKKQLHIFLADGQEGEPVTELKPVKAWAGRTLLLLSTDIESSNALITTAQDDIVGRLTGKLVDTKNTTTYRTIAAQILENLCAHCDLEKQWVMETLLPKVLREILSSKRVAPGNGVSPPNDEENQQNSATRSDEENQQNSAPRSDEENQQNSAPRSDEENHNISTQQDDIKIQETSSTADQEQSSDGGNVEQTTTSKLMREAFLSLALVIRDKLITAEDFDAAVKKEGLGPGAFVAKMKTIVEENCQETAESLRIVKLCGRIVEPMMQRDLYAQHFRNTEFVRSLSKASTIMSNLESYMLFAETDFGPRKTVRPTLSVLKNRALHLD